MNTAGTTQGAPRRDWLSRIEQTVNHAADAFLEGAETFAKHVEAAWESAARRLSLKQGKH